VADGAGLWYFVDAKTLWPQAKAAPLSWPIEKQHRLILAAERGARIKDPGGRLRVALLYPNTYQVGMANLGLQTVYRLINDRPDALCERAFLPDRPLAGLYAKAGAPLLSLETSRPVAQFDLILATISFENDAPNLAAMLELAGLEPLAARRDGPLVVAGGVMAMLNPEPLAAIVDAFALGEAEVILHPLLDGFIEHASRPKPELLAHLARQAPGFYAPSLYAAHYGPDGLLSAFEPLADAPARVAAPKYAGPPSGLAHSVTMAQGPEFGDMALIEVGRGCAHGCRFCAAGHVYRPPRLGCGADFQALAGAAAEGGGRVGLVSAAVSDLPGVDELAGAVLAAGGRLSVSSVRADRLGDDLARALAASRHQTVALAPEAGSQRLRRVINKHLDENDMFAAVERLIQAGVPNLRLYFMVGLPGETDDDVLAIAKLTAQVRQQFVSHSRGRGHLGQITASVSAFVPKPWTPFQWEPMAPVAEIKRRLKLVAGGLAGLANVKLAHETPKYARLQAVLARGDRRLDGLILALAAGQNPETAYKSAGVDPDFYAGRARRREELLPWSFIDHGIQADYLWSERQRAFEEKQSPPCQPSTCRRCGVCGRESADE